MPSALCDKHTQCCTPQNMPLCQLSDVHMPVQARFGSGIGGIIALGVPTVAAFCCGAMSVASNSRQATTAQDLTCTQTPCKCTSDGMPSCSMLHLG